MKCPYCGATAGTYIGVTDGGGVYGKSLCDEFWCKECGAIFEVGYIEYDDDDEADYGYIVEIE